MIGEVPLVRNPETFPIAQSHGVAEEIVVAREPEIVALHTGATSMTMTPGSVLSPGVLLESSGLDTRAVLVIIPEVAVTFTGMVISAKLSPARVAALLLHVTDIPDTVQVHPIPLGVPFMMTPRGRRSFTVVWPVTTPGPLLVTRII
jgi:hypothetical protein